MNTSYSRVDHRLTKLFKQGKTKTKYKQWSEEENELFDFLLSKGLPDLYVGMVFGISLDAAAKHRIQRSIPKNTDPRVEKISSLTYSLFRARAYNQQIRNKVLRYEKKHKVKILNTINVMTIEDWLESEVNDQK